MFHVEHQRVVKQMASYTMQLREYIEQASQYQDSLSTRDKIELGRTKLFDFEYPIFDTNYRKVFETNFIRKFYMREIGFETEGLFKFQLETWLLIHMPYFNKLFESELIEFNPLENSSVDVNHLKTTDKTQNDVRDSIHGSTTSGTSDTTNDATSNVTSTSVKDSTGNVTDDNFERHLKSNNPDTRLALTANDGEGVIEYASEINENNENNARNSVGNETGSGTNLVEDVGSTNTVASSKNDGTQNDTINSTINDVEDFIQHRAGKIGVQTYSKMIQEYRESFIRIEKQMHDEMQELFMLVY